MLDALPPLEAQFYAEESNCINAIGKSITIQNEIEAQYAFVGGPLSEYLAYFRRQDLPKSMWRWAAYQDVKAVSGFSVVPKKDGKSQRKLLMACSFNYWLDDIEKRSRLGMDAGGAINRLHVEGRGFDIATCDQSNAFTWVEAPQWFWYYQARPPVVALEVWDLLPQDVQCKVGRSGLASPLYTRLPMGCSHSVRILMQINLRILGQTLHHHSLLHKPVAVAVEEREDDSRPGLEVVEDELFNGCSDEQWWKRQELRRVSSECTGKSVQEWLKHIQDLKGEDVRTFVVLLLFSGERRRCDIQEELEKKASFHGLRVDIMSVDLALDPRWDLACPETFNSLMEAGEHFIDAAGGGPPCATVSRARFNRRHNGPRPVRFRDQFWGRHDLTKHEYARVVESNTLYVNSLGLMERVSSRQGLHFWEHPEDPGEHPFPSIWDTDEMLELERRVEASRVSFDQCVFGAPVPKGTTISTTCPVPEVFHQARCPGLSSLHQHTGVSQGVNSEGLFHTRRLQTYPPKLCEAIAEMLLLGLQRMKLNGLGPTGFMRVKGSVAPLSAWSTSANSKHQFGVHVMNEAVALKQRKHLSKVQGAMYLHVDDTVVITQRGAAVHADDLMQAVAENYENKGFLVPERVQAKEVVKVVGFEIDPNKGEFQLPLRKQILLHDALLHTATQGAVDVEVLRMLVGVWMHGAQLNRDLMSIPFVVYHFMEVFENEFARLWPSVKRELVAMARSVVFMRCDISRAFSNVIWASDAQGAGEGDHGGFGITASWLTEAERSDICESAETWGHTVARLSGDLSGVRNPWEPSRSLCSHLLCLIHIAGLTF